VLKQQANLSSLYVLEFHYSIFKTTTLWVWLIFPATFMGGRVRF